MVISVIGVVRLLVRDRPLRGIFNIEIVEGIMHLITGGLLVSQGFHPDTGLAEHDWRTQCRLSAGGRTCVCHARLVWADRPEAQTVALPLGARRTAYDALDVPASG